MVPDAFCQTDPLPLTGGVLRRRRKPCVGCDDPVRLVELRRGGVLRKRARPFCAPGTPQAKPGPCPKGGPEKPAAGPSPRAIPPTVKGVAAWEEQHYGSWLDGVKRFQREGAASAAAYGEEDYQEVNGLLRGSGVASGSKAQAERHVQNMDRLFQSVPPLPHDVELSRGVYGSFAQTARSLRPGDVLEDRAYVSTTAAVRVAKDFTSQFAFNRKAGVEGTVFKITVKKGAKVLPMSRLSPKQEGEILLPRGSKFRVTKNEGGVIHLEME